MSPRTQDFHMLSAGESQRRDERDDEQCEQDEPTAALPPGARAHGLPHGHGDQDGNGDADRQRPGLPQHELAQRPQHHATARDAGRDAAESARTIACETTSHTASTTRSPASPRGQCTPSPSAQKNVPKVVSTRPTTYLSSLSGSRRSGRCRSTPRPTTSTTAAAAPASAGARPPGRAARTVTIRITSTPSSSTPLNATANPGQSKRPAAGGSSSASASRSATDPARRDTPGRGPGARGRPREPQHALAQPFHAEQQQRDADHDPQCVPGHAR